MIGRDRRLHRILGGADPAVVVPIDDSLINGPTGGLLDMRSLLAEVVRSEPSAVLGFLGQLSRHHQLLRGTPFIANLTASTTRSHHTRKTQIATTALAASMGADAVAVHVNLTSRYEAEMLRTLGSIVETSHLVGIPVLAISYPRGEDDDGRDLNYERVKDEEPDRYAGLISHCVRVAVDLGADAVKTQYTGDSDTFRSVVAAADGIPVLIAGGSVTTAADSMRIAKDAIAAGASGVSFGRRVFQSPDPAGTVSMLKSTVAEGQAATGDPRNA